MTVPLIAYPFQLSPDGSVTTTEEGTDTQLAQELAVAILTRPGERVLAPEFGIADPVFVGFDDDALRLHVELFGPPINVDDVIITYVDATTQDVQVMFSTPNDLTEED